MTNDNMANKVLADYREALHRGEDVSVEQVANKIPVYALGTEQSVGSATVSLPIAPQITQQVSYGIPIVVSGMMPIGRNVMFNMGQPLSDTGLDEEQQKERFTNMGNKVLRHINAHETVELGKFSDIIRERLQYLQDSASFSNQQWKAFAELQQAVNDMMGDPYDPESAESD